MQETQGSIHSFSLIYACFIWGEGGRGRGRRVVLYILYFSFSLSLLVALFDSRPSSST